MPIRVIHRCMNKTLYLMQKDVLNSVRNVMASNLVMENGIGVHLTAGTRSRHVLGESLLAHNTDSFRRWIVDRQLSAPTAVRSSPYPAYHSENHTAAQTCGWTKNALRGEGKCYKYSFYGTSPTDASS